MLPYSPCQPAPPETAAPPRPPLGPCQPLSNHQAAHPLEVAAGQRPPRGRHRRPRRPALDRRQRRLRGGARGAGRVRVRAVARKGQSHVCCAGGRRVCEKAAAAGGALEKQHQGAPRCQRWGHRALHAASRLIGALAAPNTARSRRAPRGRAHHRAAAEDGVRRGGRQRRAAAVGAAGSLYGLAPLRVLDQVGHLRGRGSQESRSAHSLKRPTAKQGKAGQREEGMRAPPKLGTQLPPQQQLNARAEAAATLRRRRCAMRRAAHQRLRVGQREPLQEELVQLELGAGVHRVAVKRAPAGRREAWGPEWRRARRGRGRSRGGGESAARECARRAARAQSSAASARVLRMGPAGMQSTCLIPCQPLTGGQRPPATRERQSSTPAHLTAPPARSRWPPWPPPSNKLSMHQADVTNTA